MNTRDSARITTPLVSYVLNELKEMWVSMDSERVARRKLLQIALNEPLTPVMRREYSKWWNDTAIPNMLRHGVKVMSVCMTYEKIATKCYTNPPGHGSRFSGDDLLKLCHHGCVYPRNVRTRE